MYILENKGEEVYKHQDFCCVFYKFVFYLHAQTSMPHLYLKLHEIHPAKENLGVNMKVNILSLTVKILQINAICTWLVLLS